MSDSVLMVHKISKQVTRVPRAWLEVPALAKDFEPVPDSTASADAEAVSTTTGKKVK